MKPILAIVHIYYPELWDELKTCLKNITVPYDLYVTTIEKNRKLENEILKFDEQAHFAILENNGFDVGPFVHILNKVNIDNYSYIIKLHTKRDMPSISHLNYYDVSGDKWRTYALDFIKTKNNFQTVFAALENDSKIGMIGNYHLIVDKETVDKDAAQNAMMLLQKCGIPAKRFGFIAGTQFIVRANILTPLVKLNFKITDFETSDPTHKQSGLAHVLERFLGCLCLNQDFEIKDVLNTKSIFDCLFFKKLCRFIYQKGISKRNILTIKILKIPVYRKKISSPQEGR